MRNKIAIMFLMLSIFPMLATAQTTTPTSNPCSLDTVKQTTDPNGGAVSTIPKCVNQIYKWSLGLAALLAMMMIVVGGYYVMTSGGNAERASTGKEYITSALIGIVLLFCAYLLLSQINPDLVNFNLDSLNGLNPPPPPPSAP